MGEISKMKKYNKYQQYETSKKHLRYLERKGKKLQEDNFEKEDDLQAENIIKGFLTNQNAVSLSTKQHLEKTW
jgi:hypothetical protein